MNTSPIQIPTSGMKLRASWGAAVAARVEECAAEIARIQKAPPLTTRRAGNAEGVKPFALRWFNNGADVGVYIPSGSVTLAGATVMMSNVEVDGEPVPNWYEVADVPHRERATLTAHVKGRVMGPDDEAAHPVVRVTAHTVAEPAACVGDVLAFDVGSVYWSQGELTQLASGRVVLSLGDPKPFDLYWTLSGTTLSPVVAACAFSIGTVDFALASDTAVSAGAGNIYLNIDCAGQTPAVSVSATRDQSVTSLSVRLYALTSAGGVATDNRAALNSAVYYP